jgi:sec-independent protein translocase protein TatA
MTDALALAFLPSIGGPELLVLALLGVLIFGKRLPEVGKSLGKGIVEFKKGVAGVRDQIDEQASKTESLEDKDNEAEFEEADRQPQQSSHHSSPSS